MTSTRPVTKLTGASSIPQLIFGDLWEYDPAPETADPRLKRKYDLFIGGKFIAPKSGKYFDSINPATEETLAEIALAGQADVQHSFIRKPVGAYAFRELLSCGRRMPSSVNVGRTAQSSSSAYR